MIHVFQLSSFHRYEEPVKHHTNTNDFVTHLTRDWNPLSRAPPEENVSGGAPEQGILTEISNFGKESPSQG